MGLFRDKIKEPEEAIPEDDGEFWHVCIEGPSGRQCLFVNPPWLDDTDEDQALLLQAMKRARRAKDGRGAIEKIPELWTMEDTRAVSTPTAQEPLKIHGSLTLYEGAIVDENHLDQEDIWGTGW